MKKEILICKQCEIVFSPQRTGQKNRMYCSRPCAAAARYSGRDGERFWPKVDKTDGCWLWTANTGSGNYGQFKRNGKAEQAHRVSYEMAYGPIPPKLMVCHKCDTPACVRPDHLFLGTGKDNTRDCLDKGRRIACHGEKHPKAKLTWAQVKEIRTAAAQRDFAEMAQEYSVSILTIKRIINFQNWIPRNDEERATQ